MKKLEYSAREMENQALYEYSEISEEMAEATNENGGLVYGESHILL